MKFLVCIILGVLLLSGCGAREMEGFEAVSGSIESTSEQSCESSSLQETKKEEVVQQTDYDAYDKILMAYAKVISMANSGAAVKEEVADEAVLIEHLTKWFEEWEIDNHLVECRERKLKDIGYTYYDVNKDNTDELVIGVLDDAGECIYMIAIYSQYENTVVVAGCGWSRQNYYCGNDGCIYLKRSGGAFSTSYEKITIEAGTDYLRCIGNLRFEYTGETVSPWYYSDIGEISSCDEKTLISEVEGKTILNDYENCYVALQMESLLEYLQR